MIWKSHIALGVASATLIACASCDSIFVIKDIKDSFIFGSFLLGSAIGSLFPDLDSPDSYLSKKILFLNYPITKITKHRGFFHSAYFVFFLFALHFLATHFFLWYATSSFLQFAFLGFIFGYFSHQFFDAFTMGGINNWFLGQNIRFFSPNIPFVKKIAFKTGEVGERWFVWLFFLCSAIYIAYFFWQRS